MRDMKKKPSDLMRELEKFKQSGNWCNSTERVVFDLLDSLPEIGSKRISIKNKYRTMMFALRLVGEGFPLTGWEEVHYPKPPKGMRFGAESVGKTSFPPTTRRSGADKDPDETLH